jgi:tetratricopeptide (TPR) repeat protein
MKRRAVVIGINYDKYPEGASAGINPLRYAEDDARAVAKLLEEADYSVSLLIGRDATQRNILSAVLGGTKDVATEGLFVLSYAGHGGVEDGVAYLIPVDATIGELTITGIRMDDIVERHIRQARTAVALLDCCYSGDAVGVRGHRELSDEAQSRTFREYATRVLDQINRGRAVLTACSGSQLAHEPPDLQHGAFTYFALEHWRSHTGEITAESLFLAIDQGLQERGLPAPVSGGSRQGRIILRPKPHSTDATAQEVNSQVTSESSTSHAPAVAENLGSPSEHTGESNHSDERGARIDAAIVSMRMAELKDHVERNDVGNILVAADRILLIDPEHDEAKSLALSHRLDRGYAYLGGSIWVNAVDDFTRAIQLDPQNPVHHHARGTAHLGLQQWDLGIADYTQAINLSQNIPAHYFFQRGYGWLMKKEYGEARDDLERATDLDNTNAEYHRYLGRAYKALNMKRQANRSFERAVACGADSALGEMME